MIVMTVEQRRTYAAAAEPARDLDAREAGANDDDMRFLIGFNHGRRKRLANRSSRSQRYTFERPIRVQT